MCDNRYFIEYTCFITIKLLYTGGVIYMVSGDMKKNDVINGVAVLEGT